MIGVGGSLPQGAAPPYPQKAVGLLSDRFKFGVAHHQPLAAFREVDLDSRLRARTLEIEDNAFTEDSVLDHLAEFEFGFRNLRPQTGCWRSAFDRRRKDD